jgi:hypothetical protein
MPGKAVKGKGGDFGFRVRLGEFEVEIRGSRDDVLKTVEGLSGLVGSVHKAFEGVKPKTVATLTVKTDAQKEEVKKEQYPKIAGKKSLGEAILCALETDWGKWRPRTAEELREALRANAMSVSGRVLNGVLMGLVRKGMVRRWNTDTGFVYILAEEALSQKGEV